MSGETDFEVVADLRFRAQSERDQTRTRGHELYSQTKPKFVEMWRCRVPGCLKFYPVTQDALDSLAVFGAQLERLGDARLDPHQVGYCDSCRAEYKRTGADRARKRVERMANAIREIKASSTPTVERTLIEQIRQWGHPDVDGLVKALAERHGKNRGRL